MSNHLPKGLTFPEHYLTYGITIFSRPQDATGAADFDNEAAIRIAEQEVVSTQATLSEVTGAWDCAGDRGVDAGQCDRCRRMLEWWGFHHGRELDGLVLHANLCRCALGEP